MFDLVKDIQKYPEFLPWCRAARILSLTDNELIGELSVAKAGFEKSFTTRNRFVYPHSMDIALVEGPFRHLSGRWRFIDEDAGCLVHYEMRFEVAFLLAPLIGGVMEMMANTMVDCFAQRAQALYGQSALAQ